MPQSTNAPFNEFGQSMVLRDIEDLYMLIGGSGNGAAGDGQTQDQSTGEAQPVLQDQIGSQVVLQDDIPALVGANVPNPLPIARGGTGSQTAAAAQAALGPYTRANLASGVATSVIGRSANSTGAVADIAASADRQLLVRASSALAFAGWTAICPKTTDVKTSGSGASFTVPAGVTRLRIVLIGGGGGGAGSSLTGVNTVYVAASSGGAVTAQLTHYMYSGGGGGGGAMVIYEVDVAPSDTVTYTVGAGGAGVASGGGTQATNGGDSTVVVAGLTVTAGGGAGGWTDGIGPGSNGGLGGVASASGSLGATDHLIAITGELGQNGRESGLWNGANAIPPGIARGGSAGGCIGNSSSSNGDRGHGGTASAGGTGATGTAGLVVFIY